MQKDFTAPRKFMAWWGSQIPITIGFDKIKVVNKRI